MSRRNGFGQAYELDVSNDSGLGVLIWLPFTKKRPGPRCAMPNPGRIRQSKLKATLSFLMEEFYRRLR